MKTLIATLLATWPLLVTAGADVLPAFQGEAVAEASQLADARAAIQLAESAAKQGDRAGVRREVERALEFLRPLPLGEGHADVAHAYDHAGMLAWNAGALGAAREAWEHSVVHRERTLPTDSENLLLARGNLAAAVAELGDLEAARVLQEAVLAGYERTLPADHPDLIAARGNLATTLSQLGDLAAARVLDEAVLAGFERALPPDHPNVLAARVHLAVTLSGLGDHAAARDLQESALEVFERTLPEDHPFLLIARSNLAVTLNNLGEFQAARDQLERAIAVQERTLPPDHPDLLSSRTNLANALIGQGELAAGCELHAAVLAARERVLPADHPALLLARANLAQNLALVDDAPAARRLALELAAGLLQRLESLSTISAREAREVATTLVARLAEVEFLIGSGETAEEREALFALTETLRHASNVPFGTAFALEPELERLRAEAAELRTRVNDLVAGGPGAEVTPEQFAEQVARTCRERDARERELRVELDARGVFTRSIRAADVSRSLPDRSVAVGYRRVERRSTDPLKGRIHPRGDFLTAQVLRADGTLVRVDLGPAGELEQQVEDWRAALGSTVERGIAADRIAAERERAAGQALRERVLDPVLAHLGPEDRALHVCLDDVLHLVPLDALPLGEGRVGDRYRIVCEVSFARLVAPRPAPVGEPVLLALGGVDFETMIEAGQPLAFAVSAPVRGEGAGPTRSARPEEFAPLLQTRFEVDATLALYAQAFEREGLLLTKGEATKAAFHAHAPAARYLHLATHGWFASESVPSMLDTREPGEAWSPLSAEETVRGFAPMTLCGLAFAGANRGRDSLGRVPGILTAEELAGIDLSACDLAVLSACETNVGLRRAGQGVQSLQAALHAAGVRTAITSLWKVDDAATRRLMELFYTNLWLRDLPAAEALWEAKSALREEGHPVRDWAAWVLSGDPG